MRINKQAQLHNSKTAEDPAKSGTEVQYKQYVIVLLPIYLTDI
jgi:hypothetical protein